MKKIFFFCFISLSVFSQKLPEGFVYLSEVDGTILHELRYFSNNNFIGTCIDGYFKNVVITTTSTAKALKKVQENLLQYGLKLKIYDAYRPQQAVNHFVRWAKVLNDTIMKKQYYPNVDKKDLFKKGYIASKSGHSRGSTVDLTLVDSKTYEELDMGSRYDFFGVLSHVNYPKLTKQQRKNRNFLQRIMVNNGFIPYKSEWWHFTLKNEPFSKTYFNFPIQ